MLTLPWSTAGILVLGLLKVLVKHALLAPLRAGFQYLISTKSVALIGDLPYTLAYRMNKQLWDPYSAFMSAQF